MTRICLYGVDVDPVTLEEALQWITDAIAGGRRGRIVTLNTTGLMQAEQDQFFQEFVAKADLVVPDGQPLVWLAPLFGHRLPERVAGIDLLEQLADRAAGQGHSLYLLGAEDDTLATAASELIRRHPGLVVAGQHHGFLGDGAAEVAGAINASGAAILIVGMGSPRQERFIDDHWDKLGVNIAIGVGGSFEVLAKRVHRAPRWVQALGMEWAFRLLQEPRRLGRRYLETFLWLVKRTLPQVRRKRHSGANHRARRQNWSIPTRPDPEQQHPQQQQAKTATTQNGERGPRLS
jgi:N-acetylglucosaminyldiphosphoundecaprenol N-acetyl-beta-D-mannosaminyltransferase